MKILMSAFACSPIRGSEPGVGWNWAREMSKHNEVWVVTRKSNKSEIENNINGENIKFIYLSIPILNFLEKYTNKKTIHIYYSMWQKYILKYIKKINERERFDIIHHVTYNEFRNPGKLWSIGVPFIWGPIGGAQQIEKVLLPMCEGRKNIVIEYIRSYLNNFYKSNKNLKAAIKKSSKILVANNDTSIFLRLPKEKEIIFLETGIKKENMNYIIRPKKDKITILWVGNLIYLKGLTLLIEAFRRLDVKERYKVTIIGEGKLKGKYIEKIKAYGLEDYFEFKGKLSYKDTLEEYKKADIFVFTSFRDTSGNVVLEAMANCLPVIALNHHGSADMLTKDCSIKIDINSREQVIDDLTLSIEKLGNDYEKRLEKGINGYERIKNIYSWDIKGKVMNNIYKEVLNDKF